MGNRIPRDELAQGHDYTYARKKHTAIPITDEYLMALTKWVCRDSSKEYKGILMNFYTSGRDHIGKHADDEAELVSDSDIYSFSFNCPRRFWVIPNAGVADVKREIVMNDNSLIVMRGTMQSYYSHQVPKMLESERDLLKGGDERRLNITYRLF